MCGCPDEWIVAHKLTLCLADMCLCHICRLNMNLCLCVHALHLCLVPASKALEWPPVWVQGSVLFNKTDSASVQFQEEQTQSSQKGTVAGKQCSQVMKVKCVSFAQWNTLQKFNDPQFTGVCALHY